MQSDCPSLRLARQVSGKVPSSLLIVSTECTLPVEGVIEVPPLGGDLAVPVWVADSRLMKIMMVEFKHATNAVDQTISPETVMQRV